MPNASRSGWKRRLHTQSPKWWPPRTQREPSRQGRGLILILTAAILSPALHAQDSVSFGALYKPVCDALVPGFEESTATDYANWRKQNRDALAKLEADEDFLARRREALEPPPAEFAEAKVRQLTPTCEKLAGLFERAAPADAHFASAQRTFETFRAALRDANRERISACLSGNARRLFGGRLHAMNDDQLKRMEAAISELKLAKNNGVFQEGVIVQKDGQAGTVMFVKIGENWKIGEM